ISVNVNVGLPYFPSRSPARGPVAFLDGPMPDMKPAALEQSMRRTSSFWVALFCLSVGAGCQPEASSATPVTLPISTTTPPYAHPMAVSDKGVVVTCQPLAANAGLSVLQKGGTAADAFVATTLAEYVTAYGYTSLSGPLNALYFDASSKTTSYLNAGINKVS